MWGTGDIAQSVVKAPVFRGSEGQPGALPGRRSNRSNHRLLASFGYGYKPHNVYYVKRLTLITRRDGK